MKDDGGPTGKQGGRTMQPQHQPFDHRMPEPTFQQLVRLLNTAFDLFDHYCSGGKFPVARAFAVALGLDGDHAVAWLTDAGFECDCDLIDGVFASSADGVCTLSDDAAVH
jgi:hypothetical protein